MESSNSGSSSLSEGTKRELRQECDDPPQLDVDESRADFLRAESASPADQLDDACIGGIHQRSGGAQDSQVHSPSHVDGAFSDLMIDMVKEVEQFVRRYPWPTMLIGFAVGYLLSRSREK